MATSTVGEPMLQPMSMPMAACPGIMQRMVAGLAFIKGKVESPSKGSQIERWECTRMIAITCRGQKLQAHCMANTTGTSVDY